MRQIITGPCCKNVFQVHLRQREKKTMWFTCKTWYQHRRIADSGKTFCKAFISAKSLSTINALQKKKKTLNEIKQYENVFAISKHHFNAKLNISTHK